MSEWSQRKAERHRRSKAMVAERELGSSSQSIEQSSLTFPFYVRLEKTLYWEIIATVSREPVSGRTGTPFALVHTTEKVFGNFAPRFPEANA